MILVSLRGDTKIGTGHEPNSRHELVAIYPSGLIKIRSADADGIRSYPRLRHLLPFRKVTVLKQPCLEHSGGLAY